MMDINVNEMNQMLDQYTFAMIKPDAVKSKNTGKIIDIIEEKGFEIVRLHKFDMTVDGAELFYEMHKDKPFFKELVEFITSGPVIIMVLAKENAVKEWRDLMGATDSKKAAAGTIRALFGTDICQNAIHGSDSQESALREIGIFFMDEEDDEDSDDEEGLEYCEDDDCDEDDDSCCN
jgi:nucleoside-diphosphate kinase